MAQQVSESLRELHSNYNC